MKLLNSLLRIIFPDFCFGCGSYGNILCLPCSQKLPYTSNALPHGCVAPLSYQDPLTRSVILSIKTRKNPDAAEYLSRHMHESVIEILSEYSMVQHFHSPIIIPIPGSPEKLSTYGYNHADVLAAALTNKLHEYKPTLLTNILGKRSLHTKQAHTHSRSQRFHNSLQSLYLKDTSLIKNSCIIIVDDIITTGATCLTARKLLMDTGARHVICVAAAH